MSKMLGRRAFLSYPCEQQLMAEGHSMKSQAAPPPLNPEKGLGLWHRDVMQLLE